MKLILAATLSALLLGGCWTAQERRAIAEDVAAVAIRRAADSVVRKTMERDGFTAEEVERFAAWMELRAGRLADALLDQLKED